MPIKRKDGSEYKLQGPVEIHNFSPEEIITREEISDIPCEEIKVKEILIPNLPPKKKKIPKEYPKETINFLSAEIKENYDYLYDESRNSIVYGEKFQINAILKRSDLRLSVLWENKMNRGSIVYVPKDRRWWIVEDIIQRESDYIMICSPSTLQPSF